MPSGSSAHQLSFAHSIVKLVGHFVGGAVLFAVLAGASWRLGWMVSKLHGVHGFDPSALALLNLVELSVLYLDVALSGMVLVVGAYRFLKEITGF